MLKIAMFIFSIPTILSVSYLSCIYSVGYPMTHPEEWENKVSPTLQHYVNKSDADQIQQMVKEALNG